MIKTRKQLKQYEDTILSKYNTENLDIHYAKNRTYIWLQYWFDCHPSIHNDDPDYDVPTKALELYNRLADNDWTMFQRSRLTAAAIIYIACVFTGHPITQEDMANEFLTTPHTISIYYKKLKRLYRL